VTKKQLQATLVMLGWKKVLGNIPSKSYHKDPYYISFKENSTKTMIYSIGNWFGKPKTMSYGKTYYYILKYIEPKL